MPEFGHHVDRIALHAAGQLLDRGSEGSRFPERVLEGFRKFLASRDVAARPGRSATGRSHHRFRGWHDLAGSVGLELLDDAAPLSALFLLERARPSGAPRGPGQVLRDLEVVKAAEPALKCPKGRRGRERGLGRSEREGEVGQVPPITHTNPKAVQATRGWLTTGATMGGLDLATTLVPDLGEVAIEMLNFVPVRLQVQGGPKPLEQPGVALRAEEDPQEFPTDASIVDQPSANLVQPDSFLGAAREGSVREKSQRNVPVPDSAYSAGRGVSGVGRTPRLRRAVPSEVTAPISRRQPGAVADLGGVDGGLRRPAGG